MRIMQDGEWYPVVGPAPFYAVAAAAKGRDWHISELGMTFYFRGGLVVL